MVETFLHVDLRKLVVVVAVVAVPACWLAALLASEPAGPRRRRRRALGALGTPRSWLTRSSPDGQRPRASNGTAWAQGAPTGISASDAMESAGRWTVGAETESRGRALPALSRAGGVVASLPVGDFLLATPIPEGPREAVGPRAPPPARPLELLQPAELPTRGGGALLEPKSCLRKQKA